MYWHKVSNFIFLSFIFHLHFYDKTDSIFTDYKVEIYLPIGAEEFPLLSVGPEGNYLTYQSVKQIH